MGLEWGDEWGWTRTDLRGEPCAELRLVRSGACGRNIASRIRPQSMRQVDLLPPKLHQSEHKPHEEDEPIKESKSQSVSQSHS